MRDLTQDEMTQVAGGFFSWGRSSHKDCKPRTQSHKPRKPACAPKPVCQPKPVCEPKPVCKPMPVCPPGLIPNE
jgi:hypothetical protein